MRRYGMLLSASMLALTFFFAGCDKEDTDKDPYAAITVSSQQEAYVLLTTATWCTYCGQWGIPAMDGALAGEEGIDASKVNGLALHYSNSDPMFSEMSNTLKTTFGIGGPPNLWIEFNNDYNLQPAGWKNAIKARYGQPASSAGIGMVVENTGTTFTLKTKVKFFSALTGTYNLAVYVAENGIVAQQTGSAAGANHVHKMALKGEASANTAWGTEMFTGASPAEYTNTFTYTATPGSKPENLKFVAVIYKMEGGKPVSSPNSNTF